MYSNRQNTLIAINNKTNGKSLGFQINLRPLEKINMSFESIRMTNLIPNITKLNNKLNFNTVLGNLNITIPVNNYDAKELRDYLNKILNGIIIVTYAKYKYTFVSAAPFSILETTTCLKPLGLTEGLHEASLYPAYTLYPENQANLSMDNINIEVTELNIDYIEPSNNRSKTFIKVPITTMYGTILTYQPTLIKSFLLRKTNLRTLTVVLKDDYGNDISDLSFDIIFKLDYVYLPPNQELSKEQKDKNNKLIEDQRFTYSDGETIPSHITSSGFDL